MNEDNERQDLVPSSQSALPDGRPADKIATSEATQNHKQTKSRGIRRRPVALVALVSIGGFAATFVPSVALGLRDQDDVPLSPAEAPTSAAPASITTSVSSTSSTSRRAGVDPDCYGEGITCSKSRLADAESLDAAVADTITRAGWAEGCYELRYIAGDGTAKDAISVGVHGPKGVGPSRCKDVALIGGTTRLQLTQLAQSIKTRIVRTSLTSNVDTLQVTDGDKIDIQIPLP